MIYKYLNLKFIKFLNITVINNEIKEIKNYNKVNYILIINNNNVTRNLINEINKILIIKINLLHDIIKIIK